ncbi:MAG TPA: hypothetical protein VG537_11270 [Candidatus Kapabacteria bacterium]|jgi:hypothetical protein|nr:hypothetical protein [Candidatus Kapabacteria bacterium]
MIIPKDAIIAEEKVRDYLLVHRAKNDKSKLLRRLGYTHTDYWELIRDIRLLTFRRRISGAQTLWRVYAVRGKLYGPNGTSLAIKTIWILDLEDKIRFVTLVPDMEDSNDET